MKWIRDRALRGELLTGTFLNLGSSVTAEMAGKSGFDWLLFDLEHGAGDRQELLNQLQAISDSPSVPIVRIGWNDHVTVKRILDLGASGIMTPYVNTAEEARNAVAAMCYPPQGIRGVASSNRACGFGQEFETYFSEANQNLTTVVQIETTTAVDNAGEIAAVDGVDVLFVGPLDLSVSLGIPRQFDHPNFRKAIERVIAACKAHGKAAGILTHAPEMLGRFIEDGFTFVASGSDGTLVAAGMKTLAQGFQQFRR